MSESEASTAFVLGGGGALGAAEVGMLQALLEAGIAPDLIVGTSIGAFNGALLAAEPDLAGVERLRVLWTQTLSKGLIAGRPTDRLRSAMRSGGIATLDPRPIEQVLEQNLMAQTFEELPVTYQCVAASIEHAREHWFSSGPLIPAVMASAALPGMFPPQEIAGEHFIDGGVVNSIPLDRARKLGAKRAFVLQVGRIETALEPPRRPWEVAVVTFEIARRARFHAALARAEQEMEVHVLPTGGIAPKPMERANFDPLDTSRVEERIEAAHQASAQYLVEQGLA